jgi:transcriptional regulator with XRE-family HTH domain
MTGPRFGAAIRALRRRRRLRQSDLATLAGTSQQSISRIERGHIEQVSVARLQRIGAALDARAEMTVWWRGGDLDRLLDARHAALQEATIARLRSLGWDTTAEVTYAEFRERGAIDVLAWFAPERVLLVIEIKTTLNSIEETHRRHDEKVRLAARIAASRFGWHARVVARVLVLPDESTARRRVAEHRGTFDSVLPIRGRDLAAWLRAPRGSAAGIWFLSPTHARSVRHESRSRICVRSS